MQASESKYRPPIRETFYVDVYQTDSTGAEHYGRLDHETASRILAACQANGISVDMGTEGE